MQDTVRGMLKLLEYLEEKFPYCSHICQNGPGLPLTIKIKHVNQDSTEFLIKPYCEKIASEYDITLWVKYEPERYTIILVDEDLELVRTVLEDVTNNATILPVDTVMKLLRQQIYGDLAASIC